MFRLTQSSAEHTIIALILHEHLVSITKCNFKILLLKKNEFENVIVCNVYLVFYSLSSWRGRFIYFCCLCHLFTSYTKVIKHFKVLFCNCFFFHFKHSICYCSFFTNNEELIVLQNIFQKFVLFFSALFK